MSYYQNLGLSKEPFSTSPDPHFFFQSREHDRALTHILIELHLRRGLSVVLGDVGTGKTTLSRKLVQCLRERGDFVVHVVMDPMFRSEQLFLSSLVRNFEAAPPEVAAAGEAGGPSPLELKELLQRFLYEACVVDNKTVVLIIDEAQKLTPKSLEMLRVILNYETNDSKLLQLVLLGQLELYEKMERMPNFMDRISFKYMLHPLSLAETREMIDFRMRRAGYPARQEFFDTEAVELIHASSGGYPRRVTKFCHQALKEAVIRGSDGVSGDMIREVLDEERKWEWEKPILR
jgi:type II secretory pathway predicted ATPase ExeA